MKEKLKKCEFASEEEMIKEIEENGYIVLIIEKYYIEIVNLEKEYDGLERHEINRSEGKIKIRT